MKALLIVDVQNDFVRGSLPVPQAEEIFSVLDKLVHHPFDLIVATKDWHPEGHCSFSIYPPHCVQDSLGAEFAPGWDQERVDKVILKGTDPTVDSYSGFFDNERRHQTELHDYLQERKIDTLFLVGLATDICVKYTALDALQLGYKTFVIEEGCEGLDEEAVARALQEIRDAGGRVISAEEVLKP